MRADPRLTRWRHLLAWIDARRELLGVGAVAVVFCLAAYALYRLLQDVRPVDVAQAVISVPWSALAASLGWTVCGFTTMVGYDWSALRYIGRRLPLPIISFASFCGYAVGNIAGLSLLSGGSVRFRVYSTAGLRADEILRVAVFCIIAFGFGVCAVSALGVMIRPDLLAHWLGVDSFLLKLASIAAIAGIGTWIGLCWRTRTLRWAGLSLPMPSVSLTVLQLCLSAFDVLFASAALYVLLPPADGLSFLLFLPLYCVAIVAGIMSHVPGGLGVFEAVILFALADVLPTSELVGALAVYRLIYYVLPLLIAIALLGGSELTRHARRQRSSRLSANPLDAPAATAESVIGHRDIPRNDLDANP